jgi:hypothetical protein
MTTDVLREWIERSEVMPKGMRTSYSREPAKKVEKPPAKPVMKLKAIRPYHNAAISGGIGIHWNAGVVKEVNWSQYVQLVGDDPYSFERME